MVALPLSLAKTKPKFNKNATATQAKKETTAVVFMSAVITLTCPVGSIYLRGYQE
jgi:hypothetical protein